MNEDCLALTKPMETMAKLLKQRKRWMQGAVKVPFVLVFFLFLQSIFLPVVLVGLFYSPQITLLAWGGKILCQQIFIINAHTRILKPYKVWKGTWCYELYSGILSPLVLLYYLLPSRVEWKGRQY